MSTRERDERLPWAKFYFSDHQSDPGLRLCSLPARGLWMEMLCIMHASERRGFLLLNGRAIEPRQLAKLVGESPDEVAEFVQELEANGVFSRDDEGVIFSRRMSRDHAFREQQRELGRLGGNPKITPKKKGVKAGVKAPLKPEESRVEAEAEENQNPEPEKNPPPPRESACEAPEPAAVKDEDEEFLGWADGKGISRKGALACLARWKDGKVDDLRGFTLACHKRGEFPTASKKPPRKRPSLPRIEGLRLAVMRRESEFRAFMASEYPGHEASPARCKDAAIEAFAEAFNIEPVGNVRTAHRGANAGYVADMDEAERAFARSGIVSTAGETLQRL